MDKIQQERERIAFNRGLIWATEYLTRKRLEEPDE